MVKGYRHRVFLMNNTSNRILSTEKKIGRKGKRYNIYLGPIRNPVPGSL